jgi:hypothetical protein
MSADESFDWLRDIEAGVRVSDTQFDKIFPSEFRRLGRLHWTEVDVAIEATRLLMEDFQGPGPFRILDVGSNVGKFCLVGALSSQAHFTGVERRKKLVDIARKVARTHSIQRVRYQLGDMMDLDWTEFQGIYLFNPFQENITPGIAFDEELTFSQQNFNRYVTSVREKLDTCALGTRVVTYHGFGGAMPDAFERSIVPEISEHLELWVKTA